MLPQSRREFLKSLTLAGAAVFTARHLKAIELDATQPKDPQVVVGPYRKSWRDLYAEHEGSSGYRLTVDQPASNFQGMTWQEVIDTQWDHPQLKHLRKLESLGLEGKWDDLDWTECDHTPSLEAFAKAGGIPENEGEPPTWKEVINLIEPDLAHDLETSGYPTSLAGLDEPCDDWYDRVSPFKSPEGKAYEEICELLQSIENTDHDLYDAAQRCFSLIEGSGPGNSFHGVYVKTREDLGILRRLLHAAGEKVNILVC